MSILPFLHFFIFLVYSYLLVFLLWKGPKSLLNRVCAALLACFILWSFGLIFIYNPSISKDAVMLFDNVGSIGWISFSSFFLWFSIIFTEKKKILKSKLFYPFIFIPPLLFIYKQWTGFLTVDYIKQSWGWGIAWSDSIWWYLYYLYYLSFMVIGLYLILNFGRRTKESLKKKQTKIIFITALSPLILGTLTDVILPELNISGIPTLGNVFTLIWASGIVYAIVKYKLMVITPVAAAENIISTMADSLILLDREGNIATANKATLDLSGYGKYELKGKSIDIFFAEKDFKGILLDRAIKKEVIRDYELNFKTKTKDVIPVVLSSSTMMDQARGMAGIVCVIKDITERKKAEQAIIYEQSLLHALMENIPDSIYFKDRQKKFVMVNKVKAEHSEVLPEEMIGKTDFDFFPPEIAKQSSADDGIVLKSGKSIIDKVEKIIHLDKTEHWVSTTKVPWYNNEGKIIGLIGITRDITERKQAEQLQQVLYNISQAANSPIPLDELYQSIHKELGTLIDTTNFYIALVDDVENEIFFPYYIDEKSEVSSNSKLNKYSIFLNTSTSYVIKTGKPLLLDFPKLNRMKAQGKLNPKGAVTEKSIWLGVPLKIENRVIGVMAVQSYTNPNLYSEKDIKLMEFVSNQVSTVIERKKMEEELEKLAHFDALTNCCNRGYGLNMLEHQIKTAKRKKTPILLLYLDVDKFKYINDTFGHQEGDKVLKEAVKLFKSTLREVDIICRLGGDEFLLIFSESSLNDVPLIRERINKNLKKLNKKLAKPYKIDFSIGISCYEPTNPQPVDELIRIADQMMYEEKKRKNKGM